jgi:hypothetical protein
MLHPSTYCNFAVKVEDAHAEDIHAEDNDVEDYHAEDSDAEDDDAEDAHAEDDDAEDCDAEDAHAEDDDVEDYHAEDDDVEDDDAEDAHAEDDDAEDAHAEDYDADEDADADDAVLSVVPSNNGIQINSTTKAFCTSPRSSVEGVVSSTGKPIFVYMTLFRKYKGRAAAVFNAGDIISVGGMNYLFKACVSMEDDTGTSADSKIIAYDMKEKNVIELFPSKLVVVGQEKQKKVPAAAKKISDTLMTQYVEQCALQASIIVPGLISKSKDFLNQQGRYGLRTKRSRRYVDNSDSEGSGDIIPAQPTEA